MKLVMGGLNRAWLSDFLRASKASCRTIRAAVAYSQDGHELFEHCRANDVRLVFYGLLDETDAVPLRLLEHFRDRGPSRVDCKLIRGCFHPKVIWWHGYGAYIGSANLTDKAWMRNVECGVFFDESELGAGIGQQLEQMFDYLDAPDVSVPLSSELIAQLKRLQGERGGLQREERKLRESFDRAMGNVPGHRGLQFTPGKADGGRVPIVV